jgi:ketosteroid isomerase-like protein
VKTLRAAHESWNKRDFAGMIGNVAEGLAYTDHGRNVMLNDREKFREWSEGWAKAFSDGRITNPRYIDAGDTVVAEFIAVSIPSLSRWGICSCNAIGTNFGRQR